MSDDVILASETAILMRSEGCNEQLLVTAKHYNHTLINNC